MRFPKWTVLSFYLAGAPELGLFETDEQRKKVLIEIEWGRKNQRWTRFSSAGVCVSLFGLSIFVIIRDFLFPYFQVPQFLHVVGGIILTWVLVLPLVRVLYRRVCGVMLREKLLELGIPVCIKCGYSLKGLTAEVGRCPECGTGFEERVVKIMKQNPA